MVGMATRSCPSRKPGFGGSLLICRIRIGPCYAGEAAWPTRRACVTETWVGGRRRGALEGKPDLLREFHASLVPPRAGAPVRPDRLHRRRGGDLALGRRAARQGPPSRGRGSGRGAARGGGGPARARASNPPGPT